MNTLFLNKPVIRCCRRSMSFLADIKWSGYNVVEGVVLRRVRCVTRMMVASMEKQLFHAIVSSDASTPDGAVGSHYDVIISGGGMVGTSLAASLGCEPSFKNKKILLLEEGPVQKIDLPVDFNSRVCALSPASKNFLSSFGAWNGIERRRFQSVKKMQIWDSCSDSMTTFTQDSLSKDLAYIAENDVILAAIIEQLENVKGQSVEVRYHTKVKSYNFPCSVLENRSGNNSNCAEAVLDSGEVLRSKLIVGSDGFNSLLRNSAKIHSIKWDYQQLAVVATLHLSEDTINDVAWQRFLPHGPIALLPLSNDASCLIWTTTSEHARNLLKMSGNSFADAVNDAFWSDKSKNAMATYATKFIDNLANLVGLEQPIRQLPPTVLRVVEGSRKTFPLGLMHSTHYIKPRMALVGDAAHRVHPLAGQGVNLGFGDAACLTRLLVDAAYSGQDLGSLGHLLEYETERQRHVVPIMAGVDCINWLYSTSFTPTVLLRSVGSQTTNILQPIKEQMIRFGTS